MLDSGSGIPSAAESPLEGEACVGSPLTDGGRHLLRRSPMNRVVLFLVLVGAIALAAPMSAVICTIDAVPAATLLLPYFEVDLNNPNGLTTLFSVNNASATAVLVHVVLWSDLSVPVLDFHIYLPRHDLHPVNLPPTILH